MANAQTRTVTETIATGFTILFRNPLTFLVTALPQILIVGVVTLAIPRRGTGVGYSFLHPAGQPFAAAGAHLPPGEALMLAGAALIASIVTFIQIAATYVVASNLVRGGKANLIDAYGTAVDRFWSLLWAVLIVIGIVLLGSLLMAVVMAVGAALKIAVLTRVLGFGALVVWMVGVLIRYIFLTPVVLLEDSRGLSALRRSADLGRGSWGRVCGVMISALILLLAIQFGVAIVGGILSVILADSSGPARWVLALTAGLKAWIAQASLIAMMVLYTDLSGRTSPQQQTTWVPTTS